jgi:hypothetical protein
MVKKTMLILDGSRRLWELKLASCQLVSGMQVLSSPVATRCKLKPGDSVYHSRLGAGTVISEWASFWDRDPNNGQILQATYPKYSLC